MEASPMTNRFSGTAKQIEAAPQNQRTALLIDQIAQQMQQSGDPGTRQLGSDLESVKTQLVNACAPGQGGGGQHAT
jgi:hypothetical protein